MSELYEIHAFGVIDDVLDQILGNTQPLGEMSDFTKTFSTSKTRYVNRAAYPDNHLVILNSVLDELDVAVPDGAADRLLEVHQTLITNFQANGDFLTQLNTYFPEFASTATYGAMVSYRNWSLPGWIRWEEYIEGKRVQLNLWLADAAIRSNYRPYEINVIPPVRNLNSMTLGLSDFQAAMLAYRSALLLEDVRSAQSNGEHPSTDIVSLELKWRDQTTRAIQYATWTLVVYGPAGLVRSNQLQAIRTYLLNEMGEIPAQWVEVVPELDNETVLSLYPLWDRVSLESTGSVSHQYSPTVGYSEMKEALRARWDNPTDFVLDRLEHTITPFKSMSLLAHPEEIALAPKLFSELYPSYAILTTNSAEYQLIPDLDQEALENVEAACRVAETFIVDDSLLAPEGYDLEVEDNLVFLCYIVGSVKHRLVTRESWLTARG